MHLPLYGLLFAGLALCAWAGDWPADAAVDAHAPTRTLTPKVVVNSGRLAWEPYKRDLTPWPSLSHLDRRPTPPPQAAGFTPPLRGDVARGRAIALDPARGNCIACHVLPGEDWPGSLGHLLLGYRKRGHSDAYVYQQIYDRRLINPNTVMPPFGTFGLLTEQDIRDLTAYVQSLD
ncbi:MAG: sulfur oxidation c-type cytochrome SoxX [Thiobacillaceae bacterium]|nr:sulfur oxidation c-type cytochrome SoxX [Thiobacillaceae bacterium]MDW8323997.1 sulfur oxidation c-type cytochrome SoxX [Burkholderiales bacterium]